MIIYVALFLVFNFEYSVPVECKETVAQNQGEDGSFTFFSFLSKIKSDSALMSLGLLVLRPLVPTKDILTYQDHNDSFCLHTIESL